MTCSRIATYFMTACGAFGIGLLLSAVCSAADFESVESDKASEYADLLCQMASDLKLSAVKIDPNPSKAHGVHRPEEAALLIVPDKRLQEGVSENSSEVEKESGAPLGFLFTYRLVPVVADKPAAGDQLKRVSVPTDEGREIHINCLTLAVRKLSDDNWRLYVYGAGDKPLIDVPFDEGAGLGHNPLAVEYRNVSDKEGTAIVTVFDRYKARFKVRHVAAGD